MLDELKEYLNERGHKNLFIDTLPDPQTCVDAIGLFQWDHTVGEINDGTGVRYMQIQVRRASYDEAAEACRKLFEFLDSGTEETLINLTQDVFCIVRPRRGPLKMDSGAGYTTFYYELALWGQN